MTNPALPLLALLLALAACTPEPDDPLGKAAIEGNISEITASWLKIHRKLTVTALSSGPRVSASRTRSRY